MGEAPVEIAVVLVGILVVLAFFVISMYNRLVTLRQRVKEAWSDIDVQLKRRWDLIPNLVETVKGYASHESEAFEKVSNARAAAMSAKNAGESGVAEGFLSQALGGLFAIAEAYPQLRAVESFTQLQVELSNTEDQIAAARRLYNGNVQTYLTKMQQFPGALVAGPFNFETRDLFELDVPSDREPVKVDFSA